MFPTMLYLSRDQVLMKLLTRKYSNHLGSTSLVMGFTQRWHVPKSVMGVSPSEDLIRVLLHLLDSGQDCRESQSFRMTTSQDLTHCTR